MTIVFKPPGSLVHKESISDCYFSLQKYNHVTLYQDAITPPDPLFDEITYEDGSTYAFFLKNYQLINYLFVCYEEHPTSCSSKKVFLISFHLAGKI